MLYVLIVVVSLGVGLFGNRFFAGSGYGLVGDLGFSLVGGFVGAMLFRMAPISSEFGVYSALVFAAMGAGGLLLVRRSLGQI
ncbi:MAG: GlsB/YeaQ/YmgE family stress response membrane protein [bacterium]|jgi:uncharacterized membrane protein YeaQ/YmgE (transglycosylase-associated protein family)